MVLFVPMLSPFPFGPDFLECPLLLPPLLSFGADLDFLWPLWPLLSFAAPLLFEGPPDFSLLLVGSLPLLGELGDPPPALLLVVNTKLIGIEGCVGPLALSGELVGAAFSLLVVDPLTAVGLFVPPFSGPLTPAGLGGPAFSLPLTGVGLFVPPFSGPLTPAGLGGPAFSLPLTGVGLFVPPFSDPLTPAGLGGPIFSLLGVGPLTLLGALGGSSPPPALLLEPCRSRVAHRSLSALANAVSDRTITRKKVEKSFMVPQAPEKASGIVVRRVVDCLAIACWLVLIRGCMCL